MLTLHEIVRRDPRIGDEVNNHDYYSLNNLRENPSIARPSAKISAPSALMRRAKEQPDDCGQNEPGQKQQEIAAAVAMRNQRRMFELVKCAKIEERAGGHRQHQSLRHLHRITAQIAVKRTAKHEPDRRGQGETGKQQKPLFRSQPAFDHFQRQGEPGGTFVSHNRDEDKPFEAFVADPEGGSHEKRRHGDHERHDD